MTRGISLALALAAALSTQTRAATRVHAATISGQASGPACATSGPLPTTNFFGSGIPVPVGGHAGCGLAGGIQDFAAASGPTSAHLDLTNAFNGGVNTAAVDARAVEGALGVRASEAYAGGAIDGFSYLYAEAGALWSDSLDYGGTGLGYVQWLFTVDGELTVGGIGSDVFTRLNYQVNAEPIYTAFTAELGPSFTPRAFNGTGTGNLPGFAITPTSVSGADEAVSFLHLVDLSQPFDLTVGLYAAAYGRPNASSAADFFSAGARLTGIRVYDTAGNPLDVHFRGASGTFYDATGAHLAASAPEPSQWLLMIAGFGLAGAALRRRRLA